MTKLASDFERRGVLDYPGRRNEVNFITDGKEVTDLSPDNAVALDQMDTYLKERNLPGLAERIPVLAYGANVSPGNLMTKFDKYDTEGTDTSKEAMKTVPNLYVTMENTDAVWHGAPGGYAGGYFAELYQGEEVEGTTMKAVVQFLTPEQLAVMHTTEGDSYGISVIQNIDLGNGDTIDAVSYVARKSNVLLDNDGKPIAVQGVERQNSDLEVMTPRDALAYTLGTEGVSHAIGAMSPEEYVESNKELTAKEKNARQSVVQSALESEGRSREMRHPTIDTNNYGRANFVSLPRGVERADRVDHRRIELLEQSLAGIRPDRAEFEKRMLARYEASPNRSEELNSMDVDPVLKLRNQATNELADPKRAEALARRLPHVKVTQ
jgi:hypothetical protein